MKYKEKGFIQSALLLLSLGVITIGSLSGLYIAKNVENQIGFSEAQSSCPYSSEVRVYNGNEGEYFTNDTFYYENDRGDLVLIQQDFKSRRLIKSRNLPLDPTRKTNYAPGDPANVTLSRYDSSKFKVKEVFCLDNGGEVNGCPDSEYLNDLNNKIQKNQNPGETIEGFTVDCGVDIVYGWKVQDRSVPEPSITPENTPTPEPTQTPSPTSPGSQTPIPTQSIVPTRTNGELGVGKGSLQVRIEALNYPQQTPFWDENRVVSKEPKVCAREPSEATSRRPLYQNVTQVVAHCVSGECDETKWLRAKSRQGSGLAYFYNIDPGEYEVYVEGTSIFGFTEWSGCERKRWTVTAGELSREPVIILENFAQGMYNLRTTNESCTQSTHPRGEFNGKSNYIEGLTDVFCYYGEKQPLPTQIPTTVEPDPTNPADPDPDEPNDPDPAKPTKKPAITSAPQDPPKDGLVCSKGCIYSEKKSDGNVHCYSGSCPVGAEDCGETINNGCKYAPQCNNFDEVNCPGNAPTTSEISLKVESTSSNVTSVKFEFEPCLPNDDCSVTASSTQNEGDDATTQTVIKTFRKTVKGLDKNKRYRISAIPITSGGNAHKTSSILCRGEVFIDSSKNQSCITSGGTESIFFVSSGESSSGGGGGSPSNPPSRTPGYIGSCRYYDSGNCSVGNMKKYFGKFGDTVVKQASAICYKESTANAGALNDACFNLGPNCFDKNKNWIGGKNCSTFDYSIGLFQINTVFTCVEPLFSSLEDYNANRKTGQAACKAKSNTATCTNTLKTVDGNIAAALGKYVGSQNRWTPWKYSARQCGFL